MLNGGIVLEYKHEEDCESDEVIHEASKGVTSDWVVVSNKGAVCKEELLVGQDAIVVEVL